MLFTTAVAFFGAFAALALNKFLFKESGYNSFEKRQQKMAKFANYTNSADLPTFDFTSVAELVTPTVVHIKVTTGPSKEERNIPKSPDEMDPFEFFRHFDGPQGPRQGSGSGVIISDDGYIATNNHVVADASKIEVVLNDKRTYIAEIVGTDPSTDLALIRISETELPFLTFGNSDDVKVGQWVVAVGNPFNLTSTVTSGIVSAIGRNIDLLRSESNKYAIENFIQTDAAINPGNSGGALVNVGGQLIGINSAIASNTGSYAGYGFAIPVNIVKKVMDDLKNYGKVQRGLLGVSIQDISQELAEDKGLKDLKGVFVAEVIAGAAAEGAGIKKGDVILKIDGIEINSSSKLQEEVGKHRPGDKLKVSVLRGTKNLDIDVVLKSADGKTTIEVAEKTDKSSNNGMSMEPTTKEERTKLNIKNGVKVSGIEGGVFKNAGIPKGFVITHINNEPVYSVQGAVDLLENLEGAITIEGKLTDGTEKIFGVKIPKKE